MKKKKGIYLFLSISICMMLSGCTDKSSLELDSEEETRDTFDTNESGSDTENITDPEVGIDLNGTYDQNDLLVTTLEKEREGIILEIPQVEGLKDTNIQEKINCKYNFRCFPSVAGTKGNSRCKNFSKNV